MATARPKQPRAEARRRRVGARLVRARSTPPPRRRRSPRGTVASWRRSPAWPLAVFLAFVLYLGWDGGSLGRWLADATRWLVGLLAFALPLLLCFVAFMLIAAHESGVRAVA